MKMLIRIYLHLVNDYMHILLSYDVSYDVKLKFLNRYFLQMLNHCDDFGKIDRKIYTHRLFLDYLRDTIEIASIHEPL